MAHAHVFRLTSLDDLRGSAAEWDDLWWRSNVSTPTARAELVAQAIEQFASDKEFRAIGVEENGRWVAVLPLLGTRIRRLLTAGAMCASTWIPGGAFLLDESVFGDEVCDLLVQGIRELPWQLLWLADAAIESSRWNAFREGLVRTGIGCDVQEEYRIGLIQIDHDWEAFRSRWSRNHRRNMTRYGRELSRNGVRFVMHSTLAPEQAEEPIRRAFEIEDRSWKGRARSSVMRRGQFDFVLRQAKQLAQWGQLELSFLENDAGPIAFCYGFRAKGICHTCKIGYDPESAHARLGASKVLFYHLLERLYADNDCRGLDFFGRLTEATALWQPTPYPVGRLVVAPGRLLGRVALGTYRQLRRHKILGKTHHATAASENELRENTELVRHIGEVCSASW